MEQSSASEYSVPNWAVILQERGVAARRKAAESLGRLVRAQPTFADSIIPALLRGLRDEDHEVRWWSAFGLGAAGNETPQVVAALIVALSDLSCAVRDASAFSLQFFGNKAAPAVPGLLAALFDEDAGVRESAGMALLAINSADNPYMAPLLAAVTRNSEAIPALAREALQRWKPVESARR